MDRNYWENIAPGYNEEIFDVLHNDKKNIIRSAISELASTSKTVLDAGCAIGKWIPVLAPLFKKMIAADISAKNLAIAKATHPTYKNVQYLRTDLSGKAELPRCDVAVCINAILTDAVKKRDAFFHNLSTSVKKGGHLVLVVPSLESWMLTHIIQQKWKIDKELFRHKLAGRQGLEKYNNMLQGNLDIDHVPTKHYIKEELTLLLSNEKFRVLQFEKIEYDWSTEFIDIPKWLKEPRPWDWLCVSEKR